MSYVYVLRLTFAEDLYLLRLTSYVLRLTSYVLRLTFVYVLRLTSYVLRLTPCISHRMSYVRGLQYQ